MLYWLLDIPVNLCPIYQSFEVQWNFEESIILTNFVIILTLKTCENIFSILFEFINEQSMKNLEFNVYI